MAFLTVNNAKIYYETHGKSKQSLVLIAGFGCNHTFWLPLIPYLKTDFQILILDNRGSGETQDDNGDFTLETLADDVMALINFLGWEKPHIAGHSMGGSITQILAAKYANAIGKILLLNTSAKTNAVALMVLRNMLRLQEANIPLDLLVQEFIPWAFSEAFVENSKKLALYIKAVQEYPFPQTLVGNTRQTKALEVFDFRSSLNRINAKTLIVGNSRDLLVSGEELRYLKENIQNSSLTILAGGHVMLVEEPKTTVDMIKQFLAVA